MAVLNNYTLFLQTKNMHDFIAKTSTTNVKTNNCTVTNAQVLKKTHYYDKKRLKNLKLMSSCEFND